MEDKIEIGDRYECISQFLNGFIKNKIYDVQDFGKYIWFYNDNLSFSKFNFSQLNEYFKLIKKVEK